MVSHARGQQEFAEILRQRYSVEVRRVTSDIIDYAAYGHAFGYNDVSRPEIERRFGAGVIQKVEAEAAEHYRCAAPTKGPPRRYSEPHRAPMRNFSVASSSSLQQHALFGAVADLVSR
jgi:hypothetical protein